MEIGITEILKILPHRYPFLLVDRVVEVVKGERRKPVAAELHDGPR